MGMMQALTIISPVLKKPTPFLDFFSEFIYFFKGKIQTGVKV